VFEFNVFVVFKVKAADGQSAKRKVRDRLGSLDDLYRSHPNNISAEGPFDDEEFRDHYVASFILIPEPDATVEE